MRTVFEKKGPCELPAAAQGPVNQSRSCMPIPFISTFDNAVYDLREAWCIQRCVQDEVQNMLHCWSVFIVYLLTRKYSFNQTSGHIALSTISAADVYSAKSSPP